MNATKYLVALASVLWAAGVLEIGLGRVVPLRVPLDEFPRRLGTWVGRDEPLDSDTLSRTRPDAHLSRRYTDPQGRSVHLYVAYFSREAYRAQVQAACWGACEIREARPHRVQAGQFGLEVNRAIVVQDGEPGVVLYWYQQGRRVLRDSHRVKLENLRRALVHRRSDGALVRVLAPVRSSFDEAQVRAEAFVRAAVGELLRHLPE